MNRKLFFRAILALVVAGALYRLYTGQPEYTLTHITGQTMGTITYQVKYLGANAPNYRSQIDSILVALNQSLSTYIPDSEISRLNAAGALDSPSELFLDVLEASAEVHGATGGTFDPTVGPLVNAWGFGPEKILHVPDTSRIDSLRQYVGFHRVHFSPERIRMDTGMYLDLSAIAKGYAVDLLGAFLEKRGLTHYMVEIGGEVRAQGQNESGERWKIGIEDPLVDKEERRLLAIVGLKDQAMATSGNYRNYYQVGDRIIAHTIDPRTGYNTNHRLLSASVFAADCMRADAYATAFMVLGVENAKELARNAGLEVFLIFQDETGTLQSYVSPGLAPQMEMNKTE